jgi:Domain of unknown function (DUF4190)
MSDQTTPRPDSQGPGAHGASDSPAGYEPPQFVPPQGSDIPAPPLYDWSKGGAEFGPDQYGGGGYSQPAGQYGAPYSQPTPYGQANPYGQAAYYGIPGPEPRGLSVTSMICGISSVLLGWFLLPQLAAIITGHVALGREPSGKGMSITGLVLGYVCLLGYGALWVLLVVGMMAYSSNSSGY